MKYSEITKTIIRAAMRVHSALGRGFEEKYYQRALAIELNDCDLNFEKECSSPVFYKEHLIGTRRIDFIVDKIIPVELKARSSLDKGDFVQALKYLEHRELEVGLLINFGAKSLEFHRLQNKLLLNRD
jgi:GxxExxY protein